MPPQGMMENIGRTGQEETHTVGQERRRGRAVAVKITFHGFDIIFAIAAGAVKVLVQHLRGRGRQRGHDKTRVIASRHNFGFEHHTPGAGPRRRSIGELLRETATGREPLPVRPCQSGPLLMETACFLEERCRVSEQDGVPG